MNDNLTKYNSIFLDILDDNISNFEELEFKETEEWDSIAHISIISSIEELFEVSFEVEHIFEFISYSEGLKILSENYNIDFKEKS